MPVERIRVVEPGVDRRGQWTARAAAEHRARDTPEVGPSGSSAHIPVRARSRARRSAAARAVPDRAVDQHQRSARTDRGDVEGPSRDRERTGMCAPEPQGRSSGVSREETLDGAAIGARRRQVAVARRSAAVRRDDDAAQGPRAAARSARRSCAIGAGISRAPAASRATPRRSPRSSIRSSVWRCARA